MDIMEIILLIAGGVIFTLSFFIPDKKGASADVLTEEDIRKMIDRELVAVRSHLDDAVEESVSDAMESALWSGFPMKKLWLSTSIPTLC